MLLREDRERQETAGRDTRNLLNRMNFRRRKIKQLLSVWEAWQMFLASPEFTFPETNEDSIFAGELPWQPAYSRNGVTRDMLRLALYQAKEELNRTSEELEFLPIDMRVLLGFYKYQRQVICSFASTTPELSQGMAFLLMTKLRQIQSLRTNSVKLFQM
jgi:hypothetical protein